MSKGAVFWMLMILVVIFGLIISWPNGSGYMSFAPLGHNLLLFILLALLGWQVFGAPVK